MGRGAGKSRGRRNYGLNVLYERRIYFSIKKSNLSESSSHYLSLITEPWIISVTDKTLNFHEDLCST